ncbi:MAG: hypothetical protein J6S89_08765, partial [Paludibacteraceae bacterium]|nr:hypothetical protein [Paludibacteraceae bacterium]
FRYELDFFIHYFDHRYFHKKKFYDRTDTTRWVAARVMRLVGNTKYRHTDFNKVVDSVAGMMPYYPVTEYLDTVITQLNLEYLATGEIKVKHKKTRQRSIIARIKPTELKEDSMGAFTGSLGSIKFYTSNKRHIIEQLDASAFDSLLIKDTLKMEEQALTDSLNAIIAIKSVQDSAARVQDSLVALRDSFAVSASVRDSIHNALDAAIWSDEADSTGAIDRLDHSGNVAADPVSMTNLDQMIRYVEWQKQNKGKTNDSTSIKMPDLPGGVTPPVSSRPPTQTAPSAPTTSQEVSSSSSPPAEVAEEEVQTKKSKKSRKKKEQEQEVENLLNDDMSSQSSEPTPPPAPVESPKPSASEEADQSVGESDNAGAEETKKERKKKKKKKNSDAEDADVDEFSSEDGF